MIFPLLNKSKSNKPKIATFAVTNKQIILRAKPQLYIFSFLLLLLAFGCKSTQKEQAKSTDSQWSSNKRTAKQIQSTTSLLEAKRLLINGEAELAIKSIQKSLKENPDNDAAYFEMSRVFQMMGGKKNQQQALKYAQKSIDLDPDNVWYHQNIIAIYKQMDDYENAAKEAKILVKKNPDSKGNYYQLANMYIHDSDLKSALKVYQDMEKYFGYEEGVVLQRKQIYLKLGDYNKALKEIDYLIVHSPNTKKFYGMAADIYLSQGRYDKAYENYEKILAIDPTDGRVHLAISDYYRINNQPDKAYQETLIALGSSNLDIDTKVKVLLKFFKNSEKDSLAKEHTYELLDTVVAVHPKEPKALALKADFLNKEGHYEDALIYFHRVIALDNSRYLVWEQMLLVEQRLKLYSDMAEDSKQALKLFPQQPNLYFFSGLSNLEIQNYAQAEEHLKMGLNFVFDQNTKSDFYTLLAQSEFRQHKFGPAKDHFEMAIKLNPLNALALRNYAFYLAYNDNELEQAKTMASKALEIQPNDANYIYTFAFVLFKSGEIEQAKKWIQDGMLKYPENKKLQLLDQEVNKNE